MKNIDHQELIKFEKLASKWWDPQGEFKPLHEMNPLRLSYIQSHVLLPEKSVIDIGCGGGILTEALAKQGALVTGIDAGGAAINIARKHAESEGLTIHYQHITAEEMAAQHPHTFDVVTCLELLEHVPDPASLIHACARLVKPEGCVFFSTLNRNLKSYFYAILGAEYVLQLLPKRTHDYAKFIRPSELDAWARTAGLALKELKGIQYHPLSRQFELSNSVDVNYLAYCTNASFSKDFNTTS